MWSIPTGALGRERIGRCDNLNARFGWCRRSVHGRHGQRDYRYAHEHPPQATAPRSRNNRRSDLRLRVEVGQCLVNFDSGIGRFTQTASGIFLQAAA